MAQTWHDLLFAHWPVKLSALRPLVPPQLPLDTFDGSCWLGVAPFHMSGIHARGLPALPGLSSFPELNVRTYVTLNDKPGVFFFSLDAANRAAVWAARRFYRLPYFKALMSSTNLLDAVVYASREAYCASPGTESYGGNESACPFAVEGSAPRRGAAARRARRAGRGPTVGQGVRTVSLADVGPAG